MVLALLILTILAFLFVGGKVVIDLASNAGLVGRGVKPSTKEEQVVFEWLERESKDFVVKKWGPHERAGVPSFWGYVRVVYVKNGIVFDDLFPLFNGVLMQQGSFVLKEENVHGDNWIETKRQRKEEERKKLEDQREELRKANQRPPPRLEGPMPKH